MNYKQKLGYTILGAVIMSVGLGLGAIVTAPLIAQNNGVFDEVQCTTLMVVDKHGNPAVIIGANEDGNGILLRNQAGKDAIVLHTQNSTNSLPIYDHAERETHALRSYKNGSDIVIFNETHAPAVGLAVSSTPTKKGNAIILWTPDGKEAVLLDVSDDTNSLSIYNQTGTPGIGLHTDEKGSKLMCFNDKGKAGVSALVMNGLASTLNIHNEEGEKAIGLSSINEIGHNTITVHNEVGESAISLDSNILGNRINIYDTAGDISWQAR